MTKYPWTFTFLLIVMTGALNSCASVMTITTDSQVDEPAYKYIQHLTKKIEIIGVTRYPDLKSMFNSRETIELAIKLSNGGKLDSVKMITPSSNEKLNNAMLDIVTYSAPYPPLPDSITADYIVIHKRWQFDPE